MPVTTRRAWFMAGSLAPKALATFSDVRFSELWAAIYRLALRPKGMSMILYWSRILPATRLYRISIFLK